MAELKKGKIVTMKRIIHRERSDFLELERDSARKVIFLDIDGVLNQDNCGAKIEEDYIVLSAELYDRMAELCGFPGTKELIEREPRT